jgi:hypothetical protein
MCGFMIFATLSFPVGASAGMGLPIIGKLLGHTQAQTTTRYAHLASDPVKAAAAAIAGKIEDAMNQGLGDVSKKAKAGVNSAGL